MSELRVRVLIKPVFFLFLFMHSIIEYYFGKIELKCVNP